MRNNNLSTKRITDLMNDVRNIFLKKVSLKNMTLKMKLISGFAGMLAVFLGAALFNFHLIESIKEQLASQNKKVELKQTALELKEMVQELNVIASGLEISKDTSYIPVYHEKRQAFDAMIKRIGDTASTPEQIAWRSKLISLTVDYANTFDVAARLVQENKLPAADLTKNMEFLYAESQKLKDGIFTYVDYFYVVYSEEAEASVRRSQELLHDTVAVMITAFLLALASAAGIAFLLIRSFVRPIRLLLQAVGAIAQGDLRHNVNNPSKDELGMLSQSFDLMVDKVRDMLANTLSIASSLADHSRSFHEFAERTAAANAEMVKSIQEISAGTEQQAANSENSAALMAELESEMEDISALMDTMLTAGKEASMNSMRGSSAMNSLQSAAEQSGRMLDNVYSDMETLIASSRQIGTILAAIADISTQTNVLSLNASIEAARAGQHGKSFTVIANEVRQLAAQTANSSKEANRIVDMLQSSMRRLQTSIKAATETMSEQNGKVDDTISVFDMIRCSIDKLIGQIGHIHEKIAKTKLKHAALASSAQNVAAIAQETAAGVEEINAVSQTQDSSIRRIASEADDIHSLSQSLFREINQFQT